MAKRLTEKEKITLVNDFKEGKNVAQLSEEFACTKTTIIRNLKKTLGENRYKDFLSQKKEISNIKKSKEQNLSNQNEKNITITDEFSSIHENSEQDALSITTFAEIAPLDFEIEDSFQKDLASISINNIEFPKTVYMIVDKKIELNIKKLGEYPEWQFLSQEELKRETIEIYGDIKIAKRFCNKEQKVIKVPNTKVFKIVAPLLLSRGISRIIISDKLIAL